MRLREVIHTCSNDKVAEAALVSLGGAFANIVAVAAARRGLPQGRFVAELVRDFERHAGTCVWARAEQAMRGADQPVLVGLYVILAHGLLEENLRAASQSAERVPEALGTPRNRNRWRWPVPTPSVAQNAIRSFASCND